MPNSTRACGLINEVSLAITEPGAVAPDPGVNFKYPNEIRANHNHPNLTPGSGATALGSVKQSQRLPNQTDPLAGRMIRCEASYQSILHAEEPHPRHLRMVPLRLPSFRLNY